MKRTCKNKHPLIRDGSAQKARIIDALDPENQAFPKIDDRTMAELLAFAHGYAETIQYFNMENEPAGDWKSFFGSDISFVIARVSLKELAPLKILADRAMDILSTGGSLHQAQVKEAIQTLFDLIFTMAADVDEWYQKSVSGLKFEQELHRIIKAQLKQALTLAVGYFKCADAKHYLSGHSLDTALISLEDARTVLLRPFDPIWHGEESFKDLVEAIEMDCTIFQDTPSAAKGLGLIFETIYNAQAQLIHLAPSFLEETVEKYPSHAPHTALFLTFIKLFKYARDHLNTITQRRLDYFYKEILGFKEKPATPDRVHLLFELARQVDSHTVKAGTLVKAGKDASDKPVIYKIDQELSVNRAKVASLKTVFIDRDDNHRIYMAAMANSQDGQGAAFESDEPKWKTLGQSQKNLSTPAQTMVRSEIGFAVAAPVLLLNEGSRDIYITIETKTDLPSNIPVGDMAIKALTVQLSGGKEWIQTIPVNVTKEAARKLKINVSLKPSDPPVVAYEDKTLGNGFSTPFPVLKVLLKNQNNPNYLYGGLKDLLIHKLHLEVHVTGVSNLILQNDDGLNAKFPLGNRPAIGSTFYVGNREVFQKRITFLNLHYQWKDVPTSDLGAYYANYFEKASGARVQGLSNASFKGQYSLLLGRTWEPLGSQKSLFNDKDASAKAEISFSASDFNSIQNYTPAHTNKDLVRYQSGTERGFIKVQLEQPAMAFGHQSFRDIYTKRIIAYASSPGDANEEKIPNEPYTPQLNSLCLDYHAQETIDCSVKPGTEDPMLIHIHPFGHSTVCDLPDTPAYLLGRFTQGNNNPKETKGELYIGITGLVPRQHLSLLFQMAEGSADPELPKEEVNWSYLSNNQWQKFSSQEILRDATNGLRTSGIILFDMPKAATSDNTRLPPGYHWICASVQENTAAVCDTIDIAAQAVAATFEDQENHPSFLATPLAADTISKLKIKQSAIKKVKQPYASLGGKVQEQHREFYTRASERLRHKNRGITAWDYERLVLEHFPGIYKARCIPHSTYHYTDAQKEIEIPASEFAPGHVTLIVIPNLNNQNAINPLEPRASLDELDKIKAFLRKMISPFAAQRLTVINPLYEQVQACFGVKFSPMADPGVYKERLNQAIKQFLSPWAYGSKGNPAFGGKIHRSVILDFVEERSYVEHVIDFKINQIIDPQNQQTDLEQAMPSTARSIIVSHTDHEILPVTI